MARHETLRADFRLRGPDASRGEIASLFMPEARLHMEQTLEDGSIKRGDWSVEDFAKEAGDYYSQNGFWEEEIARQTERFGNIAHIFSTYESRVGDPASPPVMRGINSVQLLYRDGHWYITSIVFHTEGHDTQIPPGYLPS